MGRAFALLMLAVVLTGCGGVQVPGSGAVSLPNEFPADFPIPPSSKLLLASGPLPFVPTEMRGITVQWSSSLSRAELDTFYSKAHDGWRPKGAPVTPPSAGPVSLGTIYLLLHDGDGIGATVSVGASNMVDSGVLVQATILPSRPSPPRP